MSAPTVYLGGPILGADKHAANDWRYVVASQLKEHGIIGISPLRCEPLIGDTYGEVYDDPRFGSARAITSKNVLDVKRCDMMIAYFPEVERISLGTVAEMSWAFAWGKRAILVSRDPRVMKHPVLSESAGWLLNSLNDAVEVAVGILAGYAGGKAV